jgi:hypothetical protein
MKEAGKMRGAMNMLDVKAQLLIAVILVSATGVVSAETADPTGSPVAPAAAEVAVPKADAVKKSDARKSDVRKTADQMAAPAVVDATETAGPRADARKPDARKPHTASTWQCGWGLLSWFHSCSSGRVGLVLGTAF